MKYLACFLLSLLFVVASVKAQPTTGGASGGLGLSFVTAEITSTCAPGATIDDGCGAQVEVIGKLGVTSITLYADAAYRACVNRYLVLV